MVCFELGAGAVGLNVTRGMLVSPCFKRAWGGRFTKQISRLLKLTKQMDAPRLNVAFASGPLLGGSPPATVARKGAAVAGLALSKEPQGAGPDLSVGRWPRICPLQSNLAWISVWLIAA